MELICSVSLIAKQSGFSRTRTTTSTRTTPQIRNFVSNRLKSLDLFDCTANCKMVATDAQFYRCPLPSALSCPLRKRIHGQTLKAGDTARDRFAHGIARVEGAEIEGFSLATKQLFGVQDEKCLWWQECLADSSETLSL